jgi:hypothetical protein
MVKERGRQFYDVACTRQPKNSFRIFVENTERRKSLFRHGPRFKIKINTYWCGGCELDLKCEVL